MRPAPSVPTVTSNRPLAARACHAAGRMKSSLCQLCQLRQPFLEIGKWSICISLYEITKYSQMPSTKVAVTGVTFGPSQYPCRLARDSFTFFACHKTGLPVTATAPSRPIYVAAHRTPATPAPPAPPRRRRAAALRQPFDR